MSLARVLLPLAVSACLCLMLSGSTLVLCASCILPGVDAWGRDVLPVPWGMMRVAPRAWISFSINSSGYSDKVKRNTIFNFMKEKVKKGIVFIHETHSVSSDFFKWKSKWEGDIFLNNGTSNSRGTLIAFTKKFPCNILLTENVCDGRLQLITLDYNDTKYILIYIYNENIQNIEKLQVLLLRKLYEKLNKI